MVKNTGIEDNQLSYLDSGQVLQDSHNTEFHCLDVNVVNSLVPEKYSRIAYEFKDMGDGTTETEFIKFYGDGTKNQSQITLRSTFLGTYEITTFAFLLETTSLLDGKYIVLYDDVGSVGVWFNLDGGSLTPTTGADRDIEVDIVSGDDVDTIASKLAVKLNLDSKFGASSTLSMTSIISSTKGAKTPANGGTTTMTPAIQSGVDTLNNQYLYLNSANDRTEYYLWFNYNSTGTDPSISNKTGIEIAFTDSDSYDVLSQRVVDTVGTLEDFNASFNEHIFIQNSAVGVTFRTTDVNTDSTISNVVTGAAGTLVAKIQVFFDNNKLIESFERVV